jgi:N-acetylneuraminate synthase
VPNDSRIEDALEGGGRRCLIIGEVSQTHDGSLGTAHAFVDAIADAGADAVKFQTHLAAAESTPAEPWRVHFSRQDETRYEYWKRMEFTEEQWKGLKEHCDEAGVLFLSSAFSPEALELLARVGVPAWKVASGEITNRPLLEAMAATGLPMLLSTGMSPWSEIDGVVELLRERAAGLALLQCSTAYPCPPEQVGIEVLDAYRERYGCAVGLSDHSGTIFPSLAAAALGCDVLELHVTLSRRMFGPDVVASVTDDELRTVVDGVRFIERMRTHPVDKDGMSRQLDPLRDLFTKSIVARHDLPAGTVLTPQDLALKKPGTGLGPAAMDRLVGAVLQRPVAADELLALDDVAGAEA